MYLWVLSLASEARQKIRIFNFFIAVVVNRRRLGRVSRVLTPKLADGRVPGYGKCQRCPIGARSVAGVMSNGATSTDVESGDGGAVRDGGRDRAMSRGGSDGRIMTGGTVSGAAATTDQA